MKNGFTEGIEWYKGQVISGVRWGSYRFPFTVLIPEQINENEWKLIGVDGRKREEFPIGLVRYQLGRISEIPSDKGVGTLDEVAYLLRWYGCYRED